MRSMPIRQGTHLPQDSSLRKSMKYLATSTMQVDSSMTTMPPEPIMEPASARAVEVHGQVELRRRGGSRPTGRRSARP